MNWTYLTAGSVAVLALLGFLHKLVVGRKNATIETLEKNNTWLREQLDMAKENRPDILAERLSKRLAILEDELQRLSNDHEENRALIHQKEEGLAQTKKEVSELHAQIERAEEVLGELAYFKEQFGCPHCGAEVTTLAGNEEEYRAYSCGYLTGSHNHPCPYDPDFPKLEEYELETKYDEGRGRWYCFVKPKTRMAKMLELRGAWGTTEDEATQEVVKEYELQSKNVSKRP